jgi:ATP-binding protein involved in chromosome partitioning
VTEKRNKTDVEPAASTSGGCGAAAQGFKAMQQEQERQALAERMSHIKHKVLVLSGKGGVGKSTVAANLAISLALAGKQVGLLDIDIHGPSIPKLFALEGKPIIADPDSLEPVVYNDRLKVMSIGFLLPRIDDAIIWRGPMKYGVIKQFLKDVAWGELDYLVIDSPPGTGDEPLAVCQLLEDALGAVIVTTPQELALVDVRKSITFCRQVKLPVLGLVENMSGFVCPKCNETVNIFKSGSGEELAAEMDAPFLGRLPIDPQIVQACDEGRPYIQHFADTATAQAFQRIVEQIVAAATAATK